MEGKAALELAEKSGAVALLARMITHVAPNPEEVVFYVTEGRSKVYIEVDIPAADRGKVIGREGSMIRAIRTVFFSGLRSGDPRYDVSLVEDSGSTVQTKERSWG